MEPCQKCRAAMRLQAKDSTEETYVCSNSTCSNQVKKSTPLYQGVKWGKVALGIGLALIGIELGIEEIDHLS